MRNTLRLTGIAIPRVYAVPLYRAALNAKFKIVARFAMNMVAAKPPINHNAAPFTQKKL
jgi:hypothetical protein